MVQQGGVIVVKSAAAAAAQFVGGSRGIVLRTTSGTPPRVQRAFCNPWKARKVSPAAPAYAMLEYQLEQQVGVTVRRCHRFPAVGRKPGTS